MRKIILLLTFLISFSAIKSQQLDEFKLSKDTIVADIVVPMEGRSKEELYTKAITWIKTSYTNPYEVIESTVENDFIRFNGFKKNAFCGKVLLSDYCNDAKYNMTIYVKDNRYKLDINNVIIITEATRAGNTFYPRSENPLSLDPNSAANKSRYKKNGSIRDMFRDHEANYFLLFNGINISLFEHMSGLNLHKASNDW